MKKLMLTTMVVTAFLLTTQTEGQVRVNVDLNIGRPSWGLPGNYSGDYYYLPEIDSYYDIPRREFIYFDGRGWVYASELPYEYRDYDLFGGYKVIINEARPYLNADYYREKYNRYYNNYRRPVIVTRRYPNYPYPGSYPNNYPDDRRRYDNDRYSRGRDNQHFDNKRWGGGDDRRRGDNDDNHHERGRGNNNHEDDDR